MNAILRDIAYKLTAKKIDESKLNFIRLKISRESIRFFNLSSNEIISFSYEGKLFYFRECIEIKDKRTYFLSAIDSFFTKLSYVGIESTHFKQQFPIRIYFNKQEIEYFKNYITQKISQNKFIKTISNTFQIAEKCGFSIWSEQQYNREFFEQFGLDDIDMSYGDIAVYFLWYMRAFSSNYKFTKLVCGQLYSYFSAVKEIATNIVARALSLQDVVTHSSLCILELGDGKTMRGVLSDAAVGERMMDSRISFTGDIQRQLINLNILDVICNQVDHGPNNYNVNVDGDKCRICAFDNDNPKTFYPNFSIKRVLAGCSPLVDKKGMLNRPYLDKNIVQAICCIDIKQLNSELKPYLNWLQIRAVDYRIKRLKRVLNKLIVLQDDCLLNHNQWDQTTITNELNYKSTITYLSRAFSATQRSK